MNHLDTFDSVSSQDRFGLKLAARLSSAVDEMPHDISERLRVARLQAMGQRKLIKTQTATVVLGQSGVASLSFGEKGGLWGRFASILPLVALVLGVITIHLVQNEIRADDLAEVDAALLTDDLPPSAFTDPGFTQFLKINSDKAQ
jgi:hypothetical protein